MVITTKKCKGKLTLFCGNGELVIPIYDPKQIGATIVNYQSVVKVKINLRISERHKVALTS